MLMGKREPSPKVFAGRRYVVERLIAGKWKLVQKRRGSSWHLMSFFSLKYALESYPVSATVRVVCQSKGAPSTVVAGPGAEDWEGADEHSDCNE